MEKFGNVESCQNFESENEGEEGSEKEGSVVFFFFKRNYTFLRCYVEWSASWQLQ